MRALLFACRRGRHTDPVQLAFERLLTRGRLLFFAFQPAALLFQPGRVVAFPRYAAAAVQFQNPLGDVIEKIPVVRDGHHRSRILRQMPLEPGHRLGIQMVRRLVQQQQIRPFQQQLAEGDAPAFATGKRVHMRRHGAADS